MHGSVLILDPVPGRSEHVRAALVEDGYEVVVAATPDPALTGTYDVIVADVSFDLLERVKRRSPKTEVVLLADDDGIEDAMAAICDGAFDFILRPFFVEDVSLTVACAAVRRRGRTPTSPLHLMLKNHEVAP